MVPCPLCRGVGLRQVHMARLWNEDSGLDWPRPDLCLLTWASVLSTMSGRERVGPINSSRRVGWPTTLFFGSWASCLPDEIPRELAYPSPSSSISLKRGHTIAIAALVSSNIAGLSGELMNNL